MVAIAEETVGGILAAIGMVYIVAVTLIDGMRSRQSTGGSGPPRPMPKVKPRGGTTQGPLKPAPPYPLSYQLGYASTQVDGQEVLACVRCDRLPALWEFRKGCVAYYLRCAGCGRTSAICGNWGSIGGAAIAADSWNALQRCKAPPHVMPAFHASVSKESERELREAWGQSNLGLRRPGEGDTVTFNQGRTITNLCIEGGTLFYGGTMSSRSPVEGAGEDAGEVDILADIVGPPDDLRGDDRPRRPRKPKPGLKPLREHWWQVWRMTLEEFEVSFFNRCLVRYKKSNRR